jgi:uroporphyrin-3 C-methyltransferase
VIAGIALVFAAWQWQSATGRVNDLQQDLARRLAEGAQGAKETRSAAEQSRELVRDLQVKLGVVESRLAESQNQQVALEALYQELSASRDEWALAEIEQIVLIAAQQLQLSGNVRSALLALQTADNRLARLDRPQLAVVRKAINKDIDRLKLAPTADVVGAAVKLDNVIAAVEALPLAMELRPAPAKQAGTETAGDGAMSRILRDAWAELRGLVRIQNVEREEVPLLAPAQAFFLRENLKLRLLSARLALLSRDEATYRSDLRVAREWLVRYFEAREKPVAATVATLRALGEVPVGIEAIDISASLDAIRALKSTREKSRAPGS